MTERPDGIPGSLRPPDPAAALPGPERIAAVVLVVLVAVALVVRATGGVTPVVPQPSASRSPTPGITPEPIDTAAISVALVVNDELKGALDEIGTQLDATPLPTTEMVVTMRSMNPQLRLGLDAAQRLTRDPRTVDVGSDLATTYGGMHETIDEALANRTSNAAAYQRGGEALLAVRPDLEELDARLQQLLEGPVATPSPSVTRSPSGGPSPSGSPGASPSASPSGSPVPTGILRNPGFEGGGDGWELLLEGGAVASTTIDVEERASGESSLRVDIATGSDSRAGITVRQAGIALSAGTEYGLSAALRAAEPRELRLRVVGSGDRTYATRVVRVGPTWTTVSLSFVAFIDDPDARVQVDLGRSTATTWIDDVVFQPGGPPP